MPNRVVEAAQDVSRDREVADGDSNTASRACSRDKVRAAMKSVDDMG